MSRRIAAALAGAALLLGGLVLAAPAGASIDHWSYDQAWVWQSSGQDYCLRNRTSVTADDASHDQTGVSANAFEHFLDAQCDTGLVKWTRPAGDLAVITFLDIWTPKAGWVACMHLPWGYNTQSASVLRQDHTWKDANIMACYAAHGIYHPRGWIGAEGGSFVTSYDGKWHPSGAEAYLWSGGHEFNRG